MAGFLPMANCARHISVVAEGQTNHLGNHIKTTVARTPKNKIH